MTEQKFSTLAVVGLSICAAGLYCYRIHSSIKSLDTRIKHFKNKELLEEWRAKRDNAVSRLRVFNGKRTFTTAEANLIVNAIDDLQILRESGWTSYSMAALPSLYFSATFHGTNPLGSNDSMWLTHAYREAEPIRITNTFYQYIQKDPIFWNPGPFTNTWWPDFSTNIITTNWIGSIITNITWNINDKTNVFVPSN